MTKSATLAAAVVLAAATSALAATAPATAGPPRPTKELVAAASKRAAQHGKNVIVVFHASWCKWCRKLEAFLAEPEVAKVFASSYEIVWIDTLERKGNEALENPGGRELMAKLGGDGGLPFFVVLSPEGQTLATNAAFGYPTTPEEIETFGRVIAATGPRVSPEEVAALKARLGRR